MATNSEMIEEMANEMGFMYGYFDDGANLRTFNEWANAGYIVKKGEKAFMTLDLWKPFIKKIVDDKGKPVIDPETKKQKEELRFMLKKSALFTNDQVEKGELKPRKKRTSKTTATKKRTYKKKSA